MDVSAFIQHFPKLYHLTFASNLPGIREHGLISSNGLADLHSFTTEERETTIHTRRRCIQNMHGVSLRDQHTAHESKMKSCLVKITIPEWLSLLNGKVFFFLSREKADRFAETYQGYENLLLEVDTAALLTTHAGHMTLCRVNSGSFLYNSRPRGRNSFIPLAEYTFKNKRDTPAEVTLDVPISNILQIATVIPALELHISDVPR
jgi:hypothetical protein